MDSSSVLGFLDDTSLLSTPKSPLQSSTSRKENKQIAEKKESCFKIPNSFKNYTKDEIVLNEINDIMPKELDLNLSDSSSSVCIPDNNDSSLGLINLDCMKDFSTSELDDESFQDVKFKEKYDPFESEINQGHILSGSYNNVKEDEKSPMQTAYAHSELGSDVLSQVNCSDAGAVLTYDERLFILYGETSKGIEDMFAGVENNEIRDSGAALTEDEEQFILYGQKSKEMKEMLGELHIDTNATAAKEAVQKDQKNSETLTSKNFLQYSAIPSCTAADTSNMTDDSKSIGGMEGFTQTLKETTPFEELALEYHNFITPPSCKPNIKRWLSTINASIVNENTLTPSRANPFSNQSSFQLDDLYSNDLEQQTPFQTPKNHLRGPENESKVAAKPCQKSIKPVSLNLSIKSTDGSEIIEGLDSSMQNVSFTKENAEASSIEQNECVPETSIPFCSDILAEFKNNGQDFENLSFINDDFHSAKDLKMESFIENSFEGDNLLHKMNLGGSQASVSSIWSMQSRNQWVACPSWWTESNEEATLKLSASQVFAARSENVGALTTDENRDRPFFGNNISSPPRSRHNCTTHDEIDANFEDETGKNLASVSSQHINGSDIYDSTQNLIDDSAISRIISEISMSDRRSFVASKFLNTVSLKSTKDNSTKGQSQKAKEIKKADLKLPDPWEKPSDLSKFPTESFTRESMASMTGFYIDSIFEDQQKLLRNPSNFQCMNKGFDSNSTQLRNETLDNRIDKTLSTESRNNVMKSAMPETEPPHTIDVEPKQTIVSESCDNLQQNILHEVSEQTSCSSKKKSERDINSYRKIGNHLSSKNSPTDTQKNVTLDVPGLREESCTTALNNSVCSLTSSVPESACTRCDSSRSQCFHTHTRPGSSCSTGCTINIPNATCMTPSCFSNYNDPHNPYLLTVVPNPNYFSTSTNSLPSFGMMSQQRPYLHSGQFGSVRTVNVTPSLPMHFTVSTALQVQPISLGLQGSTVGGCVVAPTEYNHPLMCLGDTTNVTIELQNPTNSNLFYHLAFVSATLNCAPVLPHSVQVHVQDRVFAAAGASVPISLSFMPHVEGKLQLILEVSPSLSASKDAPCLTVASPHFITISVETAKPHLSLSSQEKDCLDFHSVIEKGSITELVTLTYTSLTSFPLWLGISEERTNHSLCFSESELSTASDRSNVLEWVLLTPRRIFCRLLGTTDIAQQKSIKIPIIFQAGECDKASKEIVSFTLSAGIGRSVVTTLSASLKISATVGSVVLSVLKPSSKNIVFKTQENVKAVYPLSITNTGTISAVVDLAVNCERDDFLVIPPTVEVGPKEIIPLELSFKPSSSENIKGVLQAAMRPCGKTFDLLSIDGVVVSKWISASKHSYRNFESEHKRKVDPSVPLIETDKKYLVWGGVKLGTLNSKKIIVRNTSSDKIFKASAYIKGNCDAFKIVDEKLVKGERLHLELTPLSVKCIQIMFCPNVASVFSGHLYIRPDASVSRGLFGIPLSGYGGMSEVYLMDVPRDLNGQSNLELTFDDTVNMAFGSLTLQNIGHRAAYVKIIAKNDFNFDDNPKLRVEPSEFVIMKSQTKVITVSYGSSSGDISNFCGRRYCGKLLFAYGDEILRQKLRRSKCRDGKNLKFGAEIYGIDFNLPFVDEEHVVYDESYQESPKDSYFFYSSMQTLHLNVNVKRHDEMQSFTSHFSVLTLVPDTSSDCISQGDSIVELK